MYHVLNRGNCRLRIFEKPKDYEAFLRLLGGDQIRGRDPISRIGSRPLIRSPSPYPVPRVPFASHLISPSQFFRDTTVTSTQFDRNSPFQRSSSRFAEYEASHSEKNRYRPGTRMVNLYLTTRASPGTIFLA